MQKKETILIVDDVASNIQTLASILKDDYALKIAKDGQRALELSTQEPLPDLILLDVQMPNMDGYEVLKRLQKSETTRGIPVIFVTGNDSVEDEEKGLLLGGVDYITKPVRPVIVKARVKTHLIIKAQKDELLYAALHDQMTGLYNRHYLNEAGQAKFSRAKRMKDDLSVMMIDVDHFKKVNDEHGHLIGDEVLKAVANVLKTDKRAEDFSARYGGEEFITILENCDAANAQKKANEFRKTIEALNVNGVRITASFGVSQLNPSHIGFEEVIKDADEALYEAKESGRNRVKVFNDSL